jgi:hypothetical protein
MRQQVAIASGGFALLMVALLSVAFGGRPVLETLISVSTGSSTGAVLLAAVSTIAFALGFIIVTFNLHWLLDDALFGADREARRHITSYLRAEVRKTLGATANPSDGALMGLFYEFVDRDDGSWPILRSFAFGRWTPYHVAVNWLGLSVAGIALALLSAPVRGALDWYNIGPLSFFVLALALAYWLSQSSLRPGFVSTVALPELVKMTRDLRKEFDSIVRGRFGTTAP